MRGAPGVLREDPDRCKTPGTRSPGRSTRDKNHRSNGRFSAPPDRTGLYHTAFCRSRSRPGSEPSLAVPARWSLHGSRHRHAPGYRHATDSFGLTARPRGQDGSNCRSGCSVCPTAHVCRGRFDRSSRPPPGDSGHTKRRILSAFWVRSD